MRCDRCPCPDGLKCVAEYGPAGAWACSATSELARRAVLSRSQMEAGLTAEPFVDKREAPIATALPTEDSVWSPYLSALKFGYKSCPHSTSEVEASCGCTGVKCQLLGRFVSIQDCITCLQNGEAKAPSSDEPVQTNPEPKATTPISDVPPVGTSWTLTNRRFLDWEKAMRQAPSTGVRTPSAAKELVVIRYKEDLSWLSEVPDDFAITVYDKSPTPWTLERPGCVIRMPNHGREASSMLWHLYEAHESLADWTYFVHGDARIHAEDMIHRLSLRYFDITTLTCQYRPGLPAPHVRETDKRLFTDRVEIRYGDALVVGHGGMRHWFNPTAWYALFAAPLPEHVWFCYTAEFVAPRTRLLSRPREAYAWLLDCVLRAGDVDIHSPEPLTPWQMEALWLYVLDDRFPLKVPPPSSYR